MFYSFEKSSLVSNRNEVKHFKALVKNVLLDVRFYKSLVLTDEATAKHKTVNVGDAVLVASERNGLFVAKIKALYATGDQKEEDKFAVVTWFFKQDEVPKSRIPSSSLNYEIFLCSAKNVDGVIDAETIIDTCAIFFNSVPEKDLSENVFFCRKTFDGKKFKDISGDLPNIYNKTFSSSSREKPKPKISEKSIWSTLSPTKKPSERFLSSPVSASGFGRVDALSVAQDVLQFSSDSSDSDEESLSLKTVLKRKMVLSAKENLQSTKSSISDTATNTLKRSKRSRISKKSSSAHQLEAKSKLNFKPNRVTVSLERLEGNNYSLKENDPSVPNIRRSCRLSRKADSKKTFLSTPVKMPESDTDTDISVSRDEDSSFNEKSATESDSSSGCEFKPSPPRQSLRTKGKRPTRRENEKTVHSLERKSERVRNSSKKTPKARRPFIPNRQTPLKLAANSFDEARERLHVAAVPDSLPCREEEFQTLYSFIEGKIKAKTGGCMYVSGVPGTGKTATVMEVLSCLRESVEEKVLEDFDYVDVNGMRLTEPRQAYVTILKQLKGIHATSEHASDLLTKHFNTRGKKTTLLVVDELDLLWTRKQDVLYHIFDWPSHRHARLIVVAIANTMDLPERIMMSKVSSRLGLTRLSFLPYTFKQLQEIISSRLHGLPVFESDAVQLVARKVAAVSGDARRCLDVCRRAIEISDKRRRESKESIKAASIDQVHEALQEMFASPTIKLMRNCSTHEKLFLRAIVSEFRRTGLEEAMLGDVLQHHSTLSQVEGLAPSSVASIVKVCNHLSSCRLLLLEMVSQDLYARIRLNVSVDDILFALNTD